MKAKPLTDAQRKALQSALVHGSPTRHLSGMSAWGGWGGTRASLQRRGFLNEAVQITPEGRMAIGCDCQNPNETDGAAGISISCYFHGDRASTPGPQLI